MKIAILTAVYLPTVNGVVRSIITNKEALEKLGQEVYIIAPKHRGYQDEGERVKRFPVSIHIKRGYHLYLPFSREIGKILEECDVIHVQHPFLEAITALFRKKFYKKPVVFTYHTRYDEYSKSYVPYLGESISFRRGLMATIDKFCNSCNYIIAPSKGIKDFLLYRGIKTGIEVIPTGIDINRFRADRNEIRDRYNIKGPLLLYLGRLSQEKNISTLLDAYENVSKKEKVTLMLAGEVIDRSIIERAEKDKNVILTGRVSFEETPKYYAAADLFVSASQTETQGITYAEAMASGLPIVAMRSLGSEDAISEGKNGFIVDSLEGLIEKINKLIRERDLRIRFGKKSKRLAETFDVDNTSRKLVAVYEKAISRSS